MTAPKTIWALLDERQGNTSQTLGVAEALGVPFECKKIAFNHLIRLPNFLLNNNRLGISASTTHALTPPWPDITLSTARRLGIVASYIKSQNPACFIAQIQWPGSPSKQFDLIATPLHDGAREAANVLVTLGAPHRITDATLAREAEKWRGRLAHLPSPRIAVLIGGSVRTRTFGSAHAVELATLASNLANALHGSLLVTTSRRTGKDATDALAQHLLAPHYLHAWNDNDPPEANPYFGFMGLADAVIATGESVSMCSEACSTGKPLYVYMSEDFASAKHRQFIEELYARKLARPLTRESRELFSPPFRLNDTALIAAEIKKRAF